MRQNRFGITALAALVAMFCAAAPCLADDAASGESQASIARIQLFAHEQVTTWDEGGVRVFVLPGGGTLQQGDRKVTAPQMVVWFHCAESEKGPEKVAHVSVYAQGEGRPGAAPRVPVRIATGECVMDVGAATDSFYSKAAFAWNCPQNRSEKRVWSELLATAEAMTKSAAPAGAGGALDTEIEEFFRSQNAGWRIWENIPDPQDIGVRPQEQQLLRSDFMRAFTDENAAVYLGDVRGRYGDMNLRADAAVVWYDQATRSFEVYAEGNVRLERPAGSRGTVLGGLAGTLKTLRAEQLYINPRRSRAAGTDVEMRVSDVMAEGGTVYVVRGRKLLMLDSQTFSLEEVSATTSTFARPHYQISAAKARIMSQDGVTPATLEDVRIQVGDKPHTLLWIPFLATDLSRTSLVLSDFAIGSSEQFGFTVQTAWRMDRLLGIDAGWLDEWEFFLDYYADRGLGVGSLINYDFGPVAEGTIRGYYIGDDADFDETGLAIPREDRGRMHWQHRSQLSDSWRVDGEYYHLSDAGFRQEYFEDDFDEEKDPETYLQLRFLRNSTWAALLWKEQVNDFLPQVEQGPSVTVEFMGIPIGRIVYDGTFQIGRFDLEPNKTLVVAAVDPPELTRSHTDQRLGLPFSIGWLRLDPFVRFVTTSADEALTPLGTFAGDADRTLAGGGATASATFWRGFRARSELLDVNRLRHLITPHAGFESLSQSGEDAGDFIQMDGVDALDGGTWASFGLRNLLQTKRLRDGQWRSVNWFELDVTYFDMDSDSPLAPADEDYVRADMEWRVSEKVRLHSRDNRFAQGDGMDVYNAGIAMDFLPRATITFDYDRIEGTAEAITAELILQLSDRYQLIVYEQYELDSQGTGDSTNIETRVTLRRLLPDFLLDLGVKVEEAGNDVAVMFGFGPRGWGLFGKPRRPNR